jgi:3-oxoacyl-[acyl-carrier-protein] synthase-1
MASSIQIVGVGARTPVGLRAAPAAAAVRAGISGLGDHPYMVDGVGQPMPGALDAEIDPEVIGPERFLLLADSALREACEPLDNVRQHVAMPLYLGLPELRPGFTERDSNGPVAVRRAADQPLRGHRISRRACGGLVGAGRGGSALEPGHL